MKALEIAGNIAYHTPPLYLARKAGQAVGLDAVVRSVRTPDTSLVAGLAGGLIQILFPATIRKDLDETYGFAGTRRGKDTRGDRHDSTMFWGAALDFVGYVDGLTILTNQMTDHLGLGIIPAILASKFVVNVAENILTDAGTVLHRGWK